MWIGASVQDIWYSWGYHSYNGLVIYAMDFLFRVYMKFSYLEYIELFYITFTLCWSIFVIYQVYAHDDVIKWKQFPRYWPFVRGTHRWPVNSPHKGQWRGALMVSLICASINGWVNNGEAGDLRRHGPIMTSVWCLADNCAHVDKYHSVYSSTGN